MTGPKAVERAKTLVSDLTGRETESVSFLSRDDEGWHIMLEVVELERIPQTTDILASYKVELDDEGELLRCERVNRYYRNQAGGADA
jgi:hypothetical protein